MKKLGRRGFLAWRGASALAVTAHGRSCRLSSVVRASSPAAKQKSTR